MRTYNRMVLLRMILIAVACFVASCGLFKISIGPETDEPLKEFTVDGKGRERILVIPIRGFLSDAPEKSLLGERPSVVQELVAQLRKAEKDERIKAILFEINSPGGSTTASDILYHEIRAFKERTNKKVVAEFMDVATSGGYYVALAADRIVAHPTAITGSIGVVMITPKVSGLLDKLGIAMEVTKSGIAKDIGSPFRPSTPEELAVFQEIIDRLGLRFIDLVVQHRKVGKEALSAISTAGIYLAEEALRLKLVDSIGYLDDALKEARVLASLPDGSRVIVYRRTKHGDDNLYNTSVSNDSGGATSLFDVRFVTALGSRVNLAPGPYYLWLPGILNE